MWREFPLLRTVAAGLLFLGACGEVPRPFQTGDALPPSSIDEAAEFDGVSVEPVEGVPEDAALRLAEAVSAVLQGSGIQSAASAKFRGRYVLKGAVAASAPPTAATPEATPDIAWRLIGPSGGVVAAFDQRVEGPAAAWREADPAMLEEIALGAVPEVADAYRAARERQGSAGTAHWTAVAVAGLHGLSDERRDAMLRALRGALAERRIAYAGMQGDAPYSVLGSFDIGAPRQGRRPIAVTWSVASRDGDELGKIDQENFLPDPMPHSLWREIAAAIAAGAGDGIVDLVRRTGG